MARAALARWLTTALGDLALQACRLLRAGLIVEELALAPGVEADHALTSAQGREFMLRARAETFRLVLCRGLLGCASLRLPPPRRGVRWKACSRSASERVELPATRGRQVCSGPALATRARGWRRTRWAPRIKVASTAAGGMSP